MRVWSQEFESFTPSDLARVGRELDRDPAPRRLLLQWVPHGFGYRSMNVGFCRWIERRPEPLEIMVHEPGLGFGEGGLRHDAVAAVHRFMAAILLRRAAHVWISIPGWESRLRPYALGRKVPFTWLPVPSNIPVVPANSDALYLVGYFGQYDTQSREALGAILDSLPVPVLLLGRGAERVQHPNAVFAGELEPATLSRTLQACQTVFHWYPDGVSSRRGTVMASLAHSRAIVTNSGRWTEPIWRSSGAVALASDAAGMVLQLKRLLAQPEERERLSARALAIYNDQFALPNTIRSLMAVPR